MLLEYRIAGINIFDVQGDRKAGRLPYSENEEYKSDTYRSQ